MSLFPVSFGFFLFSSLFPEPCAEIFSYSVPFLIIQSCEGWFKPLTKKRNQIGRNPGLYPMVLENFPANPSLSLRFSEQHEFKSTEVLIPNCIKLLSKNPHSFWLSVKCGQSHLQRVVWICLVNRASLQICLVKLQNPGCSMEGMLLSRNARLN